MHTPEITKCINQMNHTIRGRLEGHYQHTGVRWMLSRELTTTDVKGGILADDMGLGKTIQTIAVVCGNQLPKTLIVTTVGTVGQWKDALVSFGGMFPIVVNSSFSGIIPEDARVVVTSYSTFQKRDINSPFEKVVWSRVILDEGHTIRNHKTRVHIQLSKLECSIKWILSGTPIQNSLKELLNLAKWIGIQTSDPDEIYKTYVLRRTQEKESLLNSRLALPGLKTEVVKLDFKYPEERELYNKITLDSNATASSMECIETLVRCRQVCVSSVLYNNGIAKKKNKDVLGDVNSEIPRKRTFSERECHGDLCVQGSTKLEYLVDDIKKYTCSHRGEKCLVFCSFTLEMKLIQKGLLDLNVPCVIFDGSLSRDSKDNVLYNFKNSSIPVLLLQISCGSTGLNLQHSNRVYIVSPNWNPCIELQAIGRSYRKGQTNIVTCIRLVMRDTVEERCLYIQEKKMKLIAESFDDDSFLHRLSDTSLVKLDSCDLNYILHA